MKGFALLFLILLSSFQVIAQSEKNSDAALVINGSYSYFNKEQQFPERSFTNRRVGYLQLCYIATLNERNLFGMHSAWQESTSDIRTISTAIAALRLERTRFFELGVVYRRQRKFLKEKLLVFAQVNADAVFAKERGQVAGENYTRSGSGARLQFRPGINYVLSKTTALEFGFGRVDVLFMQWPDAPGSGFSGTISDFSLNTNFNLSSVFLGLKLNL